MKKFLVVVCLFVSMSAWYSCTRDRAPYISGPVCDSTQVSYSNAISRIVATSCTQLGGCHNPATGLGSLSGVNAIDLTTYAAVKAGVALDTTNSNSILCRIRGTTCGVQMPQYLRPLSAAQVDTFVLWQAEGYCQ